MARTFELQGHRGARGLFAENTIEGFTAVMAYEPQSIELDIAISADGVAVVVHDPSLNADLTRTADGNWLPATGPAIKTLTLEQIRAYDVGRARPGSAKAAAYPGQLAFDGARIPTLSKVFHATAASGVVIDAELKTEPDQPDLTVSPETMADLVLATASQCGATDRLAIRSFDWRGLRHVRAVAPNVKLAWLTNHGQNDATPAQVEAEARGCPFQPTWAPLHATLTRDMLHDAQARGLRVVPWTVNETADMERLIGWGVDGLCTDYPDRLRKLI